MTESDCPCLSGKRYAHCCKPLHDGEPAATAVALMRSRYTAYVLEDAKYLYRSWDPDTRPSLQTLRQQPGSQWIGLQVVSVEQGETNDSEGWVSFIASWMEGGSVQSLRERSHFVRVSRQWVYRTGEPF